MADAGPGFAPPLPRPRPLSALCANDSGDWAEAVDAPPMDTVDVVELDDEDLDDSCWCQVCERKGPPATERERICVSMRPIPHPFVCLGA